MSHAEAFGHLRSFVVGLEVKARDLRKVLESSRDQDGKWVNGKDGMGIGERCARAIGAASPEQVTKDLIAEVAEQDKLMRQVEDTMRTEHPIQEATEKYQALVEYNQLALEDLEERLAAYGYVRPARVCLNKEGDVAPPAVSSIARLPARTTKAARKSTKKNGDRGIGNNGGGGDDGVVSAGSHPPVECREGQETVAHDDFSASQQQQQQDADEEEGVEGRSGDLQSSSSGQATEESAGAGSGTGGGYHSHGGGRSAATTGQPGTSEEDEAVHTDQEEDDACGGDGVGGGAVVTPARPAMAVREEPGSPPTPASPGLADWEITQECREMLRRAQPQQQQQQKTREATNATAPRSLEALLAEKTAVSAAGPNPAAAASGSGGGRRSSASSNWSPPPSTTKDVLSSSGSSGGGRQRTDADGQGRIGGGFSGVGTPAAEGVRAARAAEPETVVAVAAMTGTGVSMSAWGSSSNPPTPARMGFEADGPWTPGGRAPAAAGTGDRESSLGSPDLSFRSPLKNDETAHLVETAMSCGKQPDVSTPSEKDSSGSVMSPPKPTPTKSSSLQGDEASLEGSLPKKGPRGDFWGNASPASSVVASSQESTDEQPAPMSPATPATPKALSPRFRIETPSAAGSSGRVTRSPSRKMALTPNNVTGSGGSGIFSGNSDDDNTHNNNSGRGSGRGSGSGGGSGGGGGSSSSSSSSSSSRGEEVLDGYDSEGCPTPELSSPLRSINISARDLQVLTPSAARADYDSNTGSGSYRRDNGDGDDDSDTCPTPELSSPLHSAGSAALCRRRLEEAGDAHDDEVAAGGGGPLELVSEEEYAKAPKFLTIQVSRSVLNDTIGNLNAYAAPRLATPSELLLTVDEIMGIIDQGELSRTLLLSAAHLKRIEMKGPRMYRIRA